MIETEQSVVIDADIGQVWDYVQHIPNWANMMPGLQDCTVLDANDSRWVLKVGVGGMVRTVKVLVHVDQWDGPDCVNFSYRLDGDPVQGGGTYMAVSKGPGQTDVGLRVRIEGGGPLAPMWEAMCRPLLPQFVRAFANQLKEEIEKAAAPVGEKPALAAKPSIFALIARWLRGLFGREAASPNP